MNNVLKNYIEMVREYLSIINGEYDMNQVGNIINAELRGLGIIDDNNGMVWISNDKHYKFIMSRKENELYRFEQSESGKYIITIDIFDNYTNILIITLRFSELDCIRILESIADFTTNYFQTFDSYVIYINPQNSNLEINMIYLENVHEFFKDQNGNDIYRDIVFKIQTHRYGDMIHDKVIMHMTYEELNNLSFSLFFNSIIDIDIDDQYQESLENIEDYILGGTDLLINEYRKNNSMSNNSNIETPTSISKENGIKYIKIPEPSNKLKSNFNIKPVSFEELNSL